MIIRRSDLSNKGNKGPRGPWAADGSAGWGLKTQGSDDGAPKTPVSEAGVRSRRSCVTSLMHPCVAGEQREPRRGLDPAFQDSWWWRDLIWTRCIWAPRGMAYCNKGPANEGPGLADPHRNAPTKAFPTPRSSSESTRVQVRPAGARRRRRRSCLQRP